MISQAKWRNDAEDYITKACGMAGFLSLEKARDAAWSVSIPAPIIFGRLKQMIGWFRFLRTSWRHHRWTTSSGRWMCSSWRPGVHIPNSMGHPKIRLCQPARLVPSSWGRKWHWTLSPRGGGWTRRW